MAWNMRHALRAIIEVKKFILHETDRDYFTKYATTLLYKLSKYSLNFFKIFPKGQGIICIRSEGISRNTFVCEYYGEAYLPSRWFEKQDALKKLCKKGTLLDFYNIILERHTDDDKGYDVLFIDPSHYGTYTSRFSHSCDPNCDIRVTAVKGSYVLGIYTIRNICYGEELCFDYNSVTESLEEYRSAICLCTSASCRQSYLYFSNSSTFQQVISVDHTVLNRHALLLRAGEEPLTDQDRMFLGQHGIKNSVLAGLPKWIIKYISLVLEYIVFEKEKLPHVLAHNGSTPLRHGALSQEQPSEAFGWDDAVDAAQGVFQNRLQNLVITVDKVKLCLRKQGSYVNTSKPLLRRMTDDEIIAYLWNGEESVVRRLLSSGKRRIPSIICREVEAMVAEKVKVVSEAKRQLLRVRQALMHVPNQADIRHVSACDYLLLVSSTEAFITTGNTFDGFTSEPAPIRREDLPRKMKVNINGIKPKYYSRHYIWGQLIFWDRQTIAEPDQSLMAARYGPICLPEAESCYTSSKLYNESARKQFLSTLRKQPSSQWRCSLPWSFKNKHKVWGTPMLDIALKLKTLDDHGKHVALLLLPLLLVYFITDRMIGQMNNCKIVYVNPHEFTSKKRKTSTE
jgi:hypothetical protein